MTLSSYSHDDLAKIEQALLERRMGITASASSQIFLRVERFCLPTTALNGQSISYQLSVRKKSDEYCVLLPRATLYQQEIELGCDVVLFPDVGS
jgi:hypothetical protein